ncbi:hypothetical protein [Chamaesiphon sp. OTE_20_metabat_361]|nr:hypothetical protein [Chamaesiphon sp. OTE_20_metabat_361]
MEANLIVIQPSNSLNPSQYRVGNIATDPMLPIVSSIAVLTALAVSAYACISRYRQKSNGRVAAPKALCHSCTYFNNNLYLNCALHPSKVLTQSAIDCVDYCPNSRAKKAEALKKSMPLVSKIFPD